MTTRSSGFEHISEAVNVPAELGTERQATCACGASFTQTHGMTQWVPPRCEACRNAADEPWRAEQIESKRRQRLSALGVPPKYSGVSLETFTLHGDEENRKLQSRRLIAARRYLADWPAVPEVIVFRGGPGTGKGHIAWSMAQELCRLHDVQVRVVKLADAVRDLREAWRSSEGLSEAQRLERYRQPDLLVIDEVSRHAFYGEPHRHLYDLVDHRVEQCRPTLLTTNETVSGLEDLLQPALTSRVAGVNMWDFGDVDYRLTKGRAA